MPSESGGSHKLLPATFLRTNIVSLDRVGSFDVLLKMLLFYVVLVAIGMWAFERSLIVMGPKMSRKTGRAVEGLVTVGMSTFDCLLVGRPFPSRAEGSKRGVCREGGGCFGISRLVVRVLVI
jgi:hypothetical protein